MCVQEEDEDDFKRRNLNPWSAFEDLMPTDADGPPDPVDKDGNPIVAQVQQAVHEPLID